MPGTFTRIRYSPVRGRGRDNLRAFQRERALALGRLGLGLMGQGSQAEPRET